MELPQFLCPLTLIANLPPNSKRCHQQVKPAKNVNKKVDVKVLPFNLLETYGKLLKKLITYHDLLTS